MSIHCGQERTWTVVNLDRQRGQALHNHPSMRTTIPIGALHYNRDHAHLSVAHIDDYRMEKLARSIRRAVADGSARRFASAAQQSREEGVLCSDKTGRLDWPQPRLHPADCGAGTMQRLNCGYTPQLSTRRQADQASRTKGSTSGRRHSRRRSGRAMRYAAEHCSILRCFLLELAWLCAEKCGNSDSASVTVASIILHEFIYECGCVDPAMVALSGDAGLPLTLRFPVTPVQLCGSRRLRRWRVLLAGLLVRPSVST